MELFDELRRGYAAGISIQGLAKVNGENLRRVLLAMAGVILPERQTQPADATQAWAD